jgi:ankyrin repeat protein|tara:strand:+ start:927 stop:2402 length:1476 start_codon:yes stop_codon:yes gene_type:complete
MKHILITAFAAVVLVGCGPSMSIQEAAEAGDIEAVKQHLAAGIDVNTRNDYFETPLHGATTHGHKEMVELLIAKGSNVNSKDHKDITPLYGPTQNGHKEIVELLITKGSDVNAKAGFGEYKGQTPLDWAEETYESDPLETKAAKKNIADLLRKHGGKTGEEMWAEESIFGAASTGGIEWVKQHLAARTDVDARDDDGKTPLHLAANHGHKEIAELLIAKGSNVNAKNRSGQTPLDMAYGEIADLLRKHGAKTREELSALIDAARNGNIEAVKQAIADGADVNAKDGKGGGTALIFASYDGNTEIAKLLISKGADVNAKSKYGYTPLNRAAGNGQKAIVELLIGNGAHVNMKDDDGHTPLNFAISTISHPKGSPEIATLLREHGAKTSKELNDGDNESAAKLKATSFKSMPEIDLDSFTEEQQTTILARANKEGCYCGCKMTVAECRNDDTSCRTSVRLAKVIVEEVTGEKPNSESKADGGKTGEELKAEGK